MDRREVEEVMLALLCTVRRKLVPAGTDTEEVQSSGAKRTLPQWVLQQHGARCWCKRLTLPAVEHAQSKAE
jgi:hypothetical protein